ncbi:MAG: prephenate dehydratase [Ignavibacterium sp.]
MVKVAFQGEQGAYSEIAALKYFNDRVINKASSSVHLVACYSFQDVFQKIQNGECEYGIIPIENSSYGSVFDTYDLLQQYHFKIIGELNLQITHHLLGLKKISFNKIKKIYSHPQALGQCSKFIKKIGNLPSGEAIPTGESLLAKPSLREKNIKIIPTYDTAGSAKILIDNKEEDVAIIASRESARIYNLKILKSAIQNNKENYTRFLIINKKQTKTKFDKPKSSISFELKSMPGALFKALSVFALRDIDLVKIESRPIPHKPFEYLFYADLMGNLKDDKIKKALAHLSELAISIKDFGTYETGKTYTG